MSGKRSLKRGRAEYEKQAHNQVSQRGREKINSLIQLLSGLLPECRESGVNKAAVLSAAVRTIERYQLFIEETNKERLKAEALNKRLKIEANSLAGSPHTPATDLYLAQLNAGQPVVPRQAGDFASLPSDAAYSEADYMDQFEFQEDGEYHSASPYSHSHGFEQHEW